MDRFAFTPVHVRARHDGWTPARQAAFIDVLAGSGCVAEACRHVGKSPRSAYKLRERPGAESFAAAWDAALVEGAQCIADAALGRAIHGVARPVYYRGRQVGERIHFNERLAMYLLTRILPGRFGARHDAADPASAPTQREHRELPRDQDPAA